MSINEEDKALFSEAMLGVKPLASNKMIEREKPKKDKTFIRRQTFDSHQQGATALSDFSEVTVNAESILSYKNANFCGREFCKIKHGEIHIQARIDLHGMNSDEAKRKLLQFIQSQLKIGMGTVLIIHGKGSRSYEPPVIKNLINTWLRQLPEVLAFHSAIPKDGGAGAVYVKLKRARI